MVGNVVAGMGLKGMKTTVRGECPLTLYCLLADEITQIWKGCCCTSKRLKNLQQRSYDPTGLMSAQTPKTISTMTLAQLIPEEVAYELVVQALAQVEAKKTVTIVILTCKSYCYAITSSQPRQILMFHTSTWLISSLSNNPQSKAWSLGKPFFDATVSSIP